MPIAVTIESMEKDQIDHGDLQDDKQDAGRCGEFVLLFRAVDLAVDFKCRLGDEKKAAADQDNVVPGNLVAVDGDDGFAQSRQRR